MTSSPGVRATNLTRLSNRDPASRHWRVLIETPKGSRNKFTYDEELGLFKLKKVLPLGAVFPFDFGFVPCTLADDGDPLDVLLLMDAPAFPGCLVVARWLGVIEAEQKEEKSWARNDRLIAVAVDSVNHRDLRKLKDLSASMLEEMEHFFRSYHELEGKPFRPLARRGPRRAQELVEKGMRVFLQKSVPAAASANGRPAKSRKG